ncbi:TPA: type II toxin-antitoxin system death-on-curing family toxin [Candidatus Woesearchaeota archaeon]|nr:type II toxin-antitoxin system death-on-curing family toxin [Candidatus Woesearchaeota archaeon]HIH39386.1 type II toxin-antitoxin system death-on-curing family toxin [Candidatus Woesearchaeota archaeon]
MISKLRCKRCYWEWIQRKEQLPKMCPHCKSPYWDKERRELTKIEYLDYKDIVEINKDIIENLPVKKADKHQILSQKKLMDVSTNYRRTEGDLFEKAVTLLKDVVKEHIFASANRRTAVEAVIIFLRINKKELGVRNRKENDEVLQGIREDYYKDTEIKNWLMGGEIREFRR